MERIRLQLFASPEEPEKEDERIEDFEEEDFDEEGDLDYEDHESDDEADEMPVYRSQEEVDDAIERRLARERRKMAEMFGVKNLEEAADYAKAGRIVAQSSGVAPSEVVNRLSRMYQGQQTPQGQQGQQPGRPAPASNPGMEQELNEIRKLIESDRVEKVKQTQEKEARTEFGKLYDEYKFDIEDKADEMGISLTDAAAIVLRPKLKDIYAQQTQKEKQVRKRRQVDSSKEAPAESSEAWRGKLSSEHLRVARKMGMTPKDYYVQGLETGLFKKE